jgi:hypothetical protein
MPAYQGAACYVSNLLILLVFYASDVAILQHAERQMRIIVAVSPQRCHRISLWNADCIFLPSKTFSYPAFMNLAR